MNLIIAAKVLIRVGDEVLVLQHSDSHPRRPFGNDLPGGIVEANESLSQGLEREIQEETNITISINEFALRYASTVCIEETDTTYIHTIFIHRLDVKPNVILSWEHASYLWVPLTAVEGLHPNYQKGLNYIVQQQLFSV